MESVIDPRRVLQRFQEKYAAVKTSPLVLRFFDKMYEKHKAQYDKGAASRADEYEVEELVSKNPKASDEELA